MQHIMLPKFFITLAPSVIAATMSSILRPNSCNLYFSTFWETSTAITSSGTQEVLPPQWEEVLDWGISTDLFHLNDPGIPTLLHHSSPDISFAPSSLTLSCSWEVRQNLGSDHQPIFLSVPVSPEVMKITRFTSPLSNVLHQSLPKPRLRHGRRLGLLSHPNLYTLFFALSLALLLLS